jgi:hypothetical protein
MVLREKPWELVIQVFNSFHFEIGGRVGNARQDISGDLAVNGVRQGEAGFMGSVRTHAIGEEEDHRKKNEDEFVLDVHKILRNECGLNKVKQWFCAGGWVGALES